LTPYMASAYVLCAPDDFEREDHPYITRSEKDEPHYTVEEEISMINKQIEESEGFDIDYTLFRCIFNYRLRLRLSQNSLEYYNKEERTHYEFVKVVKANFHTVNGYRFFFRFEFMDP
ncbi:hypothetical protein EUTSA_v10023805mg, partial [Eutrema salsugineum]